MRSLITAVAAAVTVAGVLVTPTVTASAAAPARPRIGAVSPTAGPARGGNRLTIRGRHLGNVTAVTVGGRHATQLKHVSLQRLEVVVPKHAKGRARVQLISSFGRSGSSVRYTYTAAPKTKDSKPTTIDPTQGELDDLSCPTAGFCAAVDGGDSDHRLIVMRSGQPTLATPAYSEFDLTVSCGSATYCVALSDAKASIWNGASWSAFHPVGSNNPFFEWISCAVGTHVCLANGESDAIIFNGSTSHAVARPAESELGNLSCASATFCVSVGYEVSYVYNGTKWVDAPKPAALEGSFGDASISCISSTFCLAMDPVGDVGRFDGTAWHKTADLDDIRSYTDLSCVSANRCLVVADSDYAIEYNNGSFGSGQHVAGAKGFNSLSCVLGGACVAVNDHGQTLQHTAAGWSTPTTVTPSSGDLSDVSCVSATWCVAVDQNGSAVQGAGTHWGKPVQIDAFRSLVAVSCASSALCVAVDGAGYAVTYQGGAWSAPQRIDTVSAPTDVDCPSATKCLLVDDNGRVITWNGAHWSAPVKISHRLYGISCPTTTLCVAAGARSMLLEHGKWTAIGSPVNSSYLNAVTCLRPTYCVAAGDGGFFIWHHRTWSRAIGHVTNGSGITVACSSDLVCRGVEDDTESVDLVEFAGAATLMYSADGSENDPVTSCVPNSVCVTVADDSVYTSR